MQYLGTSFSLVLGAWRLRFAVAIEDAIDEPVHVRQTHESRAPHHLYAVDEVSRRA